MSTSPAAKTGNALINALHNVQLTIWTSPRSVLYLGSVTPTVSISVAAATALKAAHSTGQACGKAESQAALMSC